MNAVSISRMLLVPTGSLLVALVLSVGELGRFDHSVMAASLAVPTASGPLQAHESPCAGGRCASAEHCRVAESLSAATVSNGPRDLDSPVGAVICHLPRAGTRGIVLRALDRVSVSDARLYLTTARLRL